MGLFEKELKEQTDESHFDRLNLDALFPTSEDKQNLQNVIKALRHVEDANLAKLKMQELGEQGLDVLIKIAKKILL